MSDRTTIEWAHAGLGRGASWNPLVAHAADRRGWHCVHVSEGCRSCYAEAINKRLGTGLAYKPGHSAMLDIGIDDKTLIQPLRWRAPRGIFVCRSLLRRRPPARRRDA
jgi:protein gp37